MKNVVSFWNDGMLSRFINSVLFEDNTVIANMKYEKFGHSVNLSLVVKGKVKIKFRNNIYYYPDEFPEELRKLIESDPYWNTNENVEVHESNCFEYTYKDVYVDEIGKHCTSDGEVCEEDISKFTDEDIRKKMEDFCEWVIESNFPHH